MNKPIGKEISAYISSQSRNKIIFYKDTLADVFPVDIGKQLALSIYRLNDDRKLPMKVSAELEKIFAKSITSHIEYGKILAISNIGILLETELKQNLNSLFDRFSQNNALFINFEGETDQEFIYFLTKEKGVKINIKNLSHIAI